MIVLHNIKDDDMTQANVHMKTLTNKGVVQVGVFFAIQSCKLYVWSVGPGRGWFIIAISSRDYNY